MDKKFWNNLGTGNGKPSTELFFQLCGLVSQLWVHAELRAQRMELFTGCSPSPTYIPAGVGWEGMGQHMQILKIKPTEPICGRSVLL